MKRTDVTFVLIGVIAIGLVLFALSSPRLKQWTESNSCVNIMSSIGLGACLWADDNSNHLADNFLAMSNVLGTPKLLICPSDKIRKPAESWAAFTANSCSYEILRPGMPANDFSNAYFRCSIHDYLGFADGTVFDGKRRRTKWP